MKPKVKMKLKLVLQQEQSKVAKRGGKRGAKHAVESSSATGSKGKKKGNQVSKRGARNVSTPRTTDEASHVVAGVDGVAGVPHYRGIPLVTGVVQMLANLGGYDTSKLHTPRPQTTQSTEIDIVRGEGPEGSQDQRTQTGQSLYRSY